LLGYWPLQRLALRLSESDAILVTNPERSVNTVEAAWANGCCLFLEVSMLRLRRFSILLIAGVVLALALPLRAAEVDKYLPDDTEIVVVLNAKQLFDSRVPKEAPSRSEGRSRRNWSKKV
jgi:hypothetical protein